MLDSNSRLPCSRQVTQQSASLFTPSDTCTWKATVASASPKFSESGHCFSKGFTMSHFAFHVEISIAWYSLLVMPVSSHPLQQRSPLSHLSLATVKCIKITGCPNCLFCMAAKCGNYLMLWLFVKFKITLYLKIGYLCCSFAWPNVMCFNLS